MALDLRAVVLVAGVGDRQLGQVERVADLRRARRRVGIRRPSQPKPAPPRSAASFSIESVSRVRVPRRTRRRRRSRAHRCTRRLGAADEPALAAPTPSAANRASAATASASRASLRARRAAARTASERASSSVAPTPAGQLDSRLGVGHRLGQTVGPPRQNHHTPTSTTGRAPRAVAHQPAPRDGVRHRARRLRWRTLRGGPASRPRRSRHRSATSCGPGGAERRRRCRRRCDGGAVGRGRCAGRRRRRRGSCGRRKILVAVGGRLRTAHAQLHPRRIGA